MIPQQKNQLKTSLPYCLYKVDTRFFKLGDIYNTKIRFTKVETTPNRRVLSSKNTETIRDRWGIDAHSNVEIYTNKNFIDIEEAEIFILKIINNFIKRCRYFDRDAVHLVPLTREDLFGLSLLTNGHGVMSVSLAGGITITDPLKIHEISSKIEQSIIDNEDISLHEELLLNAEQYLYQTDYRHPILETVIAMELVISEFIRKKCLGKNISNREANEYIKNVGLTGNIKVNLKLLSEDKHLPDEEVFYKCKSSITMRNDIVHKGRNNIIESDASNALKYSKILIDFLNK